MAFGHTVHGDGYKNNYGGSNEKDSIGSLAIGYQLSVVWTDTTKISILCQRCITVVRTVSKLYHLLTNKLEETMKKILFVFLFLVLSASLFAQEKADSSSTGSELKGYEQFDALAKMNNDVADYKKAFEQRIQEIKYVLGLVGITNEATIQEAISKDATCLRLDTAVRILEEQKKSFVDVKMFKKKKE